MSRRKIIQGGEKINHLFQVTESKKGKIPIRDKGHCLSPQSDSGTVPSPCDTPAEREGWLVPHVQQCDLSLFGGDIPLGCHCLRS